jgi:glutaconate CoA-transferase subunit A
MENKQISLAEAADTVRPGDVLALGGLMLYRRPVAFVRALLSRDPRPADLTLLTFTAAYETDLLIGAGMVSCIRACYTGLEIFGLAPMFTQAANRGALRIMEETEASLSSGIRAHLAGVSFMPGLAWLGTDLPNLRPDVRIIEDPYRAGEKVVVFPAITWDVAVLHALQADRRGNARLNDNVGIDVELSLGARDLIITTEEIVEHIERPVHIPGALVTAVVHAPRGAWPTSCYPLYPMAGGEILRYIEACNAGSFDAYLRELGAPASKAQ